MKTPIIFIHGLWLHSDSWKEWKTFFEEAGYETLAPGWPGDGETVEGTRQHPENVAGKGIQEVVEHYAAIMRTLPAKPIVIGHSFGGLIAQKLLGMDLAAAAVAIDAAPIQGVLALPFSSLKVAFVALKNPANRNRAVALTPKEFEYGFTNTLSREESAKLFAFTIPSPGRPLFEVAFSNFVSNSSAKINTRNDARGPLLLIAGGNDHTVPPAITRATYKLYKDSGAVTDVKEFPNRDHSLAINSQWREVADFVLSWLKQHSS